jgi:phosphatidylserine/phosphatidylglycerophosphate/cardiolipin synthase-like enzyme
MSHDIEGDFAEFFSASAAADDASLTADIHAQIEHASVATCAESFDYFVRVSTACGRPPLHDGDHHPVALACDEVGS